MVPVHIQVAMRGSVAVSRIGHREGLAEGEKKTMKGRWARVSSDCTARARLCWFASAGIRCTRRALSDT